MCIRDSADAMDIARGGRFDSTPSQYPDGAWFTYDDWTCEYECMVTEYTYWAHTSLLGGQADRFDEIGHEWRANTPELMISIDDYATSILQDPRLKLPKSLPDGNYRGMGLATVDELATTVPTATTETKTLIESWENIPFDSSDFVVNFWKMVFQKGRTDWAPGSIW